MATAAPVAMRDRLLDAAAVVVRRDGPDHLTLEAVAGEAGVSKGGLLYHFRAKSDLIQALVSRWMKDFEIEITDGADPRPGGLTRSYARASDIERMSPDERAGEYSLFAGLVGDPSALAGIRESYAALQGRLERDGLDPAEATVVRLAADGLWFADLLGLAPPEGELRRRVLERLAELAEGTSAA